MEKSPIYAIPGTDLNMPGIKKHCLGDCLDLEDGLMIVAGYPAYVCTHANCTHSWAEETLTGVSKSTGQPVICRLVRA